MSAPEKHVTKDRLNRLRTIWMCDRGHWHPGRNHAVKCNIRNRPVERAQ